MTTWTCPSSCLSQALRWTEKQTKQSRVEQKKGQAKHRLPTATQMFDPVNDWNKILQPKLLLSFLFQAVAEVLQLSSWGAVLPSHPPLTMNIFSYWGIVHSPWAAQPWAQPQQIWLTVSLILTAWRLPNVDAGSWQWPGIFASLIIGWWNILFVINHFTLFTQPASLMSNAEASPPKLPGTKVTALQILLFLKSLDWLCGVDAVQAGPSRTHQALASLCCAQSSFIDSSCYAMSFCHSG